MAQRPFLKEVRAWVIWFRLVGDALVNSPSGLTSTQVAKVALQARTLATDDTQLLWTETQTMSRLLEDLSAWGLVSGNMAPPEPERALSPGPAVDSSPPPSGVRRPQPPPRITPLPSYVAKLRPPGERLLKAAGWRQHLFFAHRLIAGAKIWKPLQTALAVSGGLVTLLKMVLLWQSNHTAIVAGLSGAAVFVVQLMRSHDT